MFSVQEQIYIISALSLNGVKLVLKELAAFHASGFHFIKTYPGGLEALAKEYPNTFTETFFAADLGEDMMKGFFDMIKNMFSSCALVTKNFASQELADKMAAFLPKVVPVMDGFIKSKFKLKNLTHGDAWYNNFLYRYLEIEK